MLTMASFAKLDLLRFHCVEWELGQSADHQSPAQVRWSVELDIPDNMLDDEAQ